LQERVRRGVIVVETELTGFAASVEYLRKNLCLGFEVLCPAREQARAKHRQQIVQTLRVVLDAVETKQHASQQHLPESFGDRSVRTGNLAQPFL